jgi:hypothetical protein
MHPKSPKALQQYQECIEGHCSLGVFNVKNKRTNTNKQMSEWIEQKNYLP